MKAFLLAAGFGTRLRPLTDSIPKALVEVNGKSLLERNILYLQQQGIQEVVVNVHHFADKIIQVLRDNDGFGSKVSISDERDAILETGGGLKRAAALLQGSNPFLMMNVDVLSDFDLKKMLKHHQDRQSLATLAVQQRPSSRVLLFDDEGLLAGWKHLKTGAVKLPIAVREEKLHAFAFSGIQLLEQNFLHKIYQEGKFSIMDTYLSLCKDERITAWEHTGDRWIDVGKPESLACARALIL